MPIISTCNDVARENRTQIKAISERQRAARDHRSDCHGDGAGGPRPNSRRGLRAEPLRDRSWDRERGLNHARGNYGLACKPMG